MCKTRSFRLILCVIVLVVFGVTSSTTKIYGYDFKQEGEESNAIGRSTIFGADWLQRFAKSTVTETILVIDNIEKIVAETTDTYQYQLQELSRNEAGSDSSCNEYLGEFILTAYCSCDQCCGIYAYNRPTDERGNQIIYTASGAIAKPNHTIAVDPDVLPYGTSVLINGVTYVAEDCGEGVKGNHIDIYFDNHDEALQFGRQIGDVYLVD